MIPAELIKQASFRLGFSHCGVARCESLDALRPYYNEYVEKGMSAGLTYLETYREKRLDPNLVLEEARSVIAVLFNYYPPQVPDTENNYILARYALGADYHPLMKKKLAALDDFMQAHYGPHKTKRFVDSGPVLEKAWAMRCGIGWQGKNSLLINRETGSYTFIGIILTALELEPDIPGTDHCGSCTKCVEACPTGALEQPYQVDIKRCIAYHTIENRLEIPAGISRQMSQKIYGCDICQEVCPFNRKPTPHREPELMPLTEILEMRKPEWNNLTEEDFTRLFEKSSVRRIGYRQFMRNIHAASGEEQGGGTES